MTTKLHNVTKVYGRKAALHATTLEFGRGTIALLGPNGAGKTTMLQILSTVIVPSSGDVTVVGRRVQDSHAERVEARRLIGYVPQEVVFPRGMTAFGFLDYIAVLKEWKTTRLRHAEVLRVLDLVDLGMSGTSRVRALSGGQRRRLAIAQALIGDPELLLLDEPTTGLDPEQRAGLRSVLSRQRGTVVISTHQTEDVAALCDRVIILDSGTVRFDGSVSELLETAHGRVHLDAAPSEGSVQTWRTGTGLIRSVGGQPAAEARTVEPTVEDAYILLRSPEQKVTS